MNLESLNVTKLCSNPQFAGQLAVWLRQEWYCHRGEELAQVQDRLLADNADHRLPITFVAFMHDQPVGTFTLEESKDSRTGLTLFCLSNVYVSPALRGCGIGRQLCQAAIEQTRHWGIPILSLFTISHIDYYAALGWKYVNVVPMFYRGQEDIPATQMRRHVKLELRKSSNRILTGEAKSGQ